MRYLLLLTAFGGWLFLSGCAGGKTRGPSSRLLPKQNAAATNAAGTEPKLIVTPENGLTGKVAQVNSSLRFVVLNFPLGQMPAPDQQLTVYRRGLKVGEVKVGVQQLNDNIVADIVAGEAQPGDVVRDR